MLVEIECLPTPLGTPEQPYAHVDAAIAAIAGSGLTYEVGALGTTFEGPPERAWALVAEVHAACLASGAERVLTVVKAFQAAGDAGPSMGDLVAPHR